MIKKFFALSELERNGIFILIVICCLILIGIKVWQYNYEPEPVDLSALQDSVENFYKSPPLATNYAQNTYKSYKEFIPRKENYKKAIVKEAKTSPIFEINTASYEELLQVEGIGDFYAKEIIKERNRLGGFSSYDELLGIYKMTEEKIEDFKSQLTLNVNFKSPKIPINKSDTIKLQNIPAIDAYCASRIVSYRERLGGYYCLEQLLEINCIDSVRYQEILLRIKLDSTNLRKLDINNDDFKTIMKHPYIDGYENTKTIFRYLDFDEINSMKEFIDIPNIRIKNPEMLEYYIEFLPKKKKSED